MNEMTEKASWSPKSFVVAQVKQKGFVVAHELRGRSVNIRKGFVIAHELRGHSIFC